MASRRTHLVAALSAAGLLAAACGTDEPRVADAVSRAGASTSVSPSAAATTPSRPAVPSASPSPSGPVPSPIASVGPGERALSVLTLNGYAEWGGTDPKVKWVAGFEQETGCKVSIRYYDPYQEEKPDDFSPSSFDVISATPVVGGRLIAQRKVAPLNTTLVGGYDRIPRTLRELASVNQDDQVYGVPFLWGTSEVLYDSAKVRPAGAEAIFTDEGPVVFRDSPLSLADAALVLKERGADIADPFDLTPAQLDEAAALFSSEKAAPGRRLFWRDPIEVVQAFATGSARLAQGTPYLLDVLTRGHTKVRAVTDRPVTGWADSWMVSAQAAHPSCAYQWLEWNASPDVQRRAAMWNGLAPADPDACKGRARAIRRICADYRVGDAKAFAGVFFAVRPPDYAQWADRWSRIAPRPR
ncbi:extracellular solute-binding protein [Microbispora corallina]|uniref:extracellular solute-binding protein n=1 Tax=Microbispora corallina TaxID=83302 RepID=UPI00194E40EA|nr:extracellular solute-binding protein [Microbispora corallina]